MPTPYDQDRFDPPAPLVTIQIIHPSQKETKTNAEMKLDSGSDITCIPISINKEIPHLRSGFILADDYDGNRTVRTTRYVTLKIGKKEFPAIEVIEINDEIGLLGRDILNLFKTNLDGPNLEFELG